MKNEIIITLPSWARIGSFVMVKDVNCIRGCSPKAWYREKIVGFGYDGVFHQAHNCPVYYTRFSEWGKTIRKDKYY